MSKPFFLDKGLFEQLNCVETGDSCFNYHQPKTETMMQGLEEMKGIL